MKNDGQQQNGNQAAWWQPALALFARLSAWIAVPVLAGVFVGRWLDRKFGTEPWLFLGTVGFAFLISMVGLVLNTLKEYKKIETESKKSEVRSLPAGKAGKK